MSVEKKTILDLRSLGQSGLRRFSGFLYDEIAIELQGWRGCAIYKEMGLNDPTVSGILFAIDKLCRRVPWRVEAASQESFDLEAAEFLEQCMDDMETTWIDMIGEILSFLQYGHSLHEIVYKRRCGDDQDPTRKSKHADGRIGWRGIPIRSQDTLYRWRFSDAGDILGVEQMSPPNYHLVFIPAEKFLLFRTGIHKNNPQGMSMLRGAYISWFRKKNIENVEAIGIERDLCGLPMALVPPEYLSPGASNDQKQLLHEIKTIVTNVRRDEQEGLIFPLIYDSTGKPLFEFKLLSSGGSRNFDTDKVIQRYDQRIAMSMMADFMLLGSTGQGSFAMHSDKTKLFSMALGAYLDIIAETFNRFAIPRLFALNDLQISNFPKLVHGDCMSVDLAELGSYLGALSSAGMPLFPNPELEDYLLKVANLPENLQEMSGTEGQVQPSYSEPLTNVKEVRTAEDLNDSGIITNESGSTERQSSLPFV